SLRVNGSKTMSFVSSATVWKTGNGRDLDTPPPGVPLLTLTSAEPADATSAACTMAVSWVLSTKVVGRLVPFQLTVEVGAKFDPFTVSVNVEAPARTDWGARDDRAGAGL